jgi:hypothetical protein
VKGSRRRQRQVFVGVRLPPYGFIEHMGDARRLGLRHWTEKGH